MKLNAGGACLPAIGSGAVLLVTGMLLAAGCVFATPWFIIGLILHLLGLALCIGGYSALTARGYVRPRPAAPVGAALPLKSRRRRAADLHPGIRFLRAALALLLVSTVAAALARMSIDLKELVALHDRGQVTQAQVFNKERAAELGNAATGLVYYSFRAEGVSVTGRFRAARINYPQFRTGRRLTVTYLPANPRIHRIGLVGDERTRQEAVALVLLFLTRAADLGMPLYVLERALRRQLWLARYGVEITGTIVGCKPVTRAGRRTGYRVRYEFELWDGRVVGGSAQIGQLDGEPTLVGFPLTVLYDVRRPQRNRPLAAFRHVRFRGIQPTLLAA